MGSEGVIQAIAERLTKLLKATRCTIRVPREETLWLMVSHGADIESRPKEVKINEDTIAGQAFISGEIVHVKDITKDLRYDPSYIEPHGPREVAAIPIIYEGVCYGVIQIYREKGFSKRQIAFAEILAQSVGPTLYHIETSKISRRAIGELVGALFGCATLEEMFPRAVDIISSRIGIESCLIYKVFPRFANKELWCEIVAGVPPGEHEIGLSESLEKHRDVKWAAERKEIEIIDLLMHTETEHLRDWANNKQIRRSMYVPLILKGKNKEEADKVIGVMILEARREKMGFSAEEKSFAFDSGEIIAQLIQHDLSRDKSKGIAFKEIEDAVLNPSQAMAGFAERSFEPILKICHVAKSVCKGKEDACEGAKDMCGNAELILENAVTIRTESKKIGAELHRIRMIHFDTSL